jgi:hypothetical protein
MSANDRQVGGDHYKTQYEHWDLVEDSGTGYLEAVASKYITRWRKKAGLQDLEKAQHYIDKLLERARLHGRTGIGYSVEAELQRYFQCNEMGATEQQIVRLLHQWKEVWQLTRAAELTSQLITDYKLAMQAAGHPGSA